MPIRQVPNTSTRYYLLCFDAKGAERQESDGSLLSETVRQKIADPAEGITDVFLASHGWKGDVPAAVDQYDRWVGEVARSADRASAEIVRSGFTPIVIGIHWPSLPFGDEAMDTAEGGLLSGDAGPGVEQQVDEFAATLGDTPTTRRALRTILDAARQDVGQWDELPGEVRAAYDDVFAEAFPGDPGIGPLGAPPGADHAQWNPNAMYREAREAAAMGDEGPGLLGGDGISSVVMGLLLAPLRQMSFWKMKDRAREIGETGAHALLRRLQDAAASGVRFHLMGHSFGCIVVSAAIAGPPGAANQPAPVHSLFLVQGALSLWSFCAGIPYSPRESGYFNRIIRHGLVEGPIVTTHSTFDTAVKSLYPKAAALAGHLVLDEELPKYGGVGVFGAQGIGEEAEGLVLQAADGDYGFKKGRVYNLEASGIIKSGGGFSGAHSDIAHPEVAHAMWQAVLAAS
jgi:hypothetical protein